MTVGYLKIYGVKPHGSAYTTSGYMRMKMQNPNVTTAKPIEINYLRAIN